MRRLLARGLSIGVFAFCAVAFAAPPAPRWFPLTAAEPGAPSLVAAGRPDQWEARVSLPGMWLSDRSTFAGPRGVLDIEAGGRSGAVGQPDLPVLRWLVEVPRGAVVTASLVPGARTRATLAELGLPPRLLPVQPPQPKVAGAFVPYVEDAKAYALDAYLPAQPVEIVGRAVVRGRDLVLVEVRPVRYNPARGLLDIVTDARVALAISGGSPAAAERDALRLRSRAHDGALAGAVRAGALPAPPDKGAGGGAAEGAEGLLVVVHDSLAAAIEPLVDWKRKSGYKVEVVPTSSLGASPNDVAVKNAIQARYDAWSNPGLGFVLLVGDTNLCPIHTGNGGGKSQVTDNWYAAVDGTDYLPDLAIARISTRSAAETQAVVAKLLTYERATFPTTEWIKNAGFIGTEDSGHIAQIEGTHNFCIDTYMTPNGYRTTPWSHGGSSSDRHYNTFNADTSEIAASINAGRSIVNYSGHGSTTSWAGPTSHGGYGQADVRANTNDGMYPFVISNACITGSLAVDECFAETWQKVPNKGAIGFWGASNNSYWDEDDVLQRALYGNVFPVDQTPPLGILTNLTKLDLYQHYGDVGNVRYYYDMYNLLSEPSLALWTRVPRTPTVGHPGAIPVGETQFTVTVSVGGQPVAGALVAVRRADDGVFESAYTDAAGSVTLTMTPPPVSVGPLEVTVTGRDLRPYEDTADVIAPNSPWLVHRTHGVDDAAGGDGDGHANPGETIVVPVTVENVGQLAGTGLAGTLATSTPEWVTVEDAAASFPDLAPHATGGSLPDHYRVRVAPSVPDGALLGFELHWTAADGSSGTTSFVEGVLAPNVDYRAHAVDDSSGNANGVAGPGETVDMTVTLANVGHRGLTGVRGVLSTASPYVTVLEDEAGFPDLAAGAEATNPAPGFRFAVAANAPDNQPVTFSLRVLADGGHDEVVTFDVPVSSCSRTEAVDVPKAIADNSVVTSTLPYDRGILIGELNVRVQIAHTYIGDLRVSLISPAGTTVVLHDRSGGSTDNLATWYDTETAPAQPLSAFNGQSSRGTWTLRVEDLAGGDTGQLEHWTLEVCGEPEIQAPRLEAVSHVVDDAGACDPDGIADVGETATFRVRVRNSGTQPATGVVVGLASPARLTVLGGPVPLGTLAAGQEADAAFQVVVGAVGCVENAPFTVTMTADQGEWTGGFSEVLEADVSGTDAFEDVEHGGAPPAGWTHRALYGTDDWAVVSTSNHTPSGGWSWFVSDPAALKDDVLVTPDYAVGPAGRLEFWHRITSESTWDGGVVEISADGGSAWTDLGPQITAGPYDAALQGGPLAGRRAWTGTFAWRQTVVDLAPWAGRTVRFRFRFSADDAVSGTGWWVDDVLVRGRSEGCDTHACGIPGEARLTAVTKNGGDVVLGWANDPLAVRYTVRRSADPRNAAGFADVTGEDPDPTDTTFRDRSTGGFAAWLIVEVGPDGEGPWGHFGQ